MSSLLTSSARRATIASSTPPQTLLTVVWPIVGGSIRARLELDEHGVRLCVEIAMRGSHAAASRSMCLEDLDWSVLSGETWSESRLLACVINNQCLTFDLVSMTHEGRTTRVLLTNLPTVVGFAGATYSQPSID
ncbi:MAG: hypothetical protein EXS10_10630 [Phycisphaerales bacterium]|nr:hypothetical protein [Phycisphaerales bacterium]